MNILIVSQHFFPDNFRINDIAVKLTQSGNNITVLTSLPDYATGYVPEEYKQKFKDDYFGVNVIRVKTKERKSGVKNRALNYLSFLTASKKEVKKMDLKKFDCIMCYQTSPIFMAHAAITAKKKSGKKLIIYCLDLWPESLKVWGIKENNPLFKLMNKYSKWAYNKADVIAVSSNPFKEYLNNVNNVPLDKMVYLPQHSNRLNLSINNNITADLKNESIKKETKEEQKETVFAFGGNIGAAQDVECIIKAAALIKDKNFKINIYGDGSELENVKNKAKELNVNEKVKFFGRVTFNDLQEHYKKADAFILTLKQSGAVGNTVPAKLQEYMSGNKPIFSAAGKGATEIIENADCGKAVPPSDYKALSQALADFIDNPEKYKNCGRNGLKYFNKNYTLDIFETRLLKIIRENLLEDTSN